MLRAVEAQLPGAYTERIYWRDEGPGDHGRVHDEGRHRDGAELVLVVVDEEIGDGDVELDHLLLQPAHQRAERARRRARRQEPRGVAGDRRPAPA